MKIYNLTIIKTGHDKVGLKSLNPSRPIPSCDTRLKSHLIPTPSPLRDGENSHRTKQGGVGQAGLGKSVIPTKN